MLKSLLKLSAILIIITFIGVGCSSSESGDGDGESDLNENMLTWYEDSDGDGYGDSQTTTEAESQPVGYVSDNTDCDDTNQTTYPGADEICEDAVDQDCDGADLLCVPTDGLIAYYKFDGNADDSSGNDSDGTIYGNSVLFVDGHFNQAIQFDNSSSGTFTVNDYVDLPNITINELSVSHWVKYTSGSSSFYDGCTYSIGAFPSLFFNVRIDNTGEIKGQIYRDGVYYNTEKIDISDHEWHLITVTVNKSHMKIYQDETEVDSIELGFDLNYVDAVQKIALHIFANGMSSRFTGELDNFLIYNQVLSPTEISNIFNR